MSSEFYFFDNLNHYDRMVFMRIFLYKAIEQTTRFWSLIPDSPETQKAAWKARYTNIRVSFSIYEPYSFGIETPVISYQDNKQNKKIIFPLTHKEDISKHFSYLEGHPPKKHINLGLIYQTARNRIPGISFYTPDMNPLQLFQKYLMDDGHENYETTLKTVQKLEYKKLVKLASMQQTKAPIYAL